MIFVIMYSLRLVIFRFTSTSSFLTYSKSLLYFPQLGTRTKKFQDSIDKYGLKSWHGLVFSIPIIIISFLMMVGTIMSWAHSTTEWFICILTWLLLPLLILIVTLSVIGCGAASILLVMNAGESCCT